MVVLHNVNSVLSITSFLLWLLNNFFDVEDTIGISFVWNNFGMIIWYCIVEPNWRKMQNMVILIPRMHWKSKVMTAQNSLSKWHCSMVWNIVCRLWQRKKLSFYGYCLQFCVWLQQTLITCLYCSSWCFEANLLIFMTFDRSDDIQLI